MLYKIIRKKIENITGAKMTRSRNVGGAEMTGAEMTGAEETVAEMVCGRSI